LANLLVTPDIGFVSRGLYTRCHQDTVENIRGWLGGHVVGS
jgi:phosphoglycerate dehydrogenase-like enzyme